MSTDVRDLRRLDEATQWVYTLKDRAVDEKTLTAWLNWSADAQNLREFERLQGIWGGVATLERQGLLQRPEARRLNRPFLGAMAAGVLLALGVAVWWAWPWSGSIAPGSYRTEVAATAHIPLVDGTQIQLAPLSKLSTEFTTASRHVHVEAGEAYFEVARDPHRPFIVDVGRVRVTAVGTAFDIHEADDVVRVTVIEGIVNVADGSGSAPIRAEAGQRVEYLPRERGLAVSSADVHVATAWRSGVLKFVDEPLANVVADLNRYSVRKIIIADPQLETLPYTGTVFVGRVDQWLVALQDAFPLHVEAPSPDRVRLTMK